MFMRNIGRVPSGSLNFGSDAVIGMSTAPSVTGLSQFPGQLGSTIELDDTMAGQLSTPAVGTLLAGVYEYVQFDASVTWKRGMVCFWDETVAANLYRVTVTEANGGTAGAVSVAGYVLHPNTGTTGALTPLQFGWIQILGKASALFRANLTSAGAIGSPVYAAAAGAGADNATSDVLGSGAGATVTSVALAQLRLMGMAQAAPVGGQISVIDMHGGRNFRFKG